MSPEQRADLVAAVHLLENPNLAARVADIVGTPIEKAIALLPARAHEMISAAAQKAIHGALKVAVATMDKSAASESSDWWHIGAISASGAAGGFFGLPGMALELPLSTLIMLRSIADIARSEGIDLSSSEAQLECVKVFAFGGNTSGDDGAEIGYYVAREALLKMVADAAAHIAEHGLEKEGAPAIVRAIVAIAERYAIKVSEKTAAQLIPIIGAAGGAAINAVFMSHFQDVARGHFTVTRLERALGYETVKAAYKEIRDEQRTKRR